MQAGTGVTGVTIGKFYPPHLGHLHLIVEAARQVETLHVVVCHRVEQVIPGERRAAWLADAAPANVELHVTPDDLPEEPAPWAARTCAILGRSPDVAFTSQGYGEAWAAEMGARHVAVDVGRGAVPISGTALRANLAGLFHMLVPAARAALGRRVVLVGAESTGKTRLAQQLAERLGTVWVPEYGREYWEGRRYLREPGWTSDEFIHIAAMQRESADALARRGVGGVVIGDTDALATAVWHRRYLDGDDAALETLVEEDAADAYLLCDIDLPWFQDGTRESREQRETMHAEFVTRLQRMHVPWRLIAGEGSNRFDAALDALRALVEPVSL